MLDADRIADRRRLKRSLNLWRVIAVLAVAALGAYVALAGRTDLSGDYVARLRLDDIIFDESWREEALRTLASDARCRALVVRIDSPGGTFVGGQTMMMALRRVAAEKPVVAVMGEMATSGAYMSALGADHMIANPGTLTGSIGVILQSAEITELLAKLGVEPVTIKSAPLKATPNPFEPLTDDARTALRDTVMDTFAQFVDMVVERRRMDRAAVEAVADGRVFTGRQALALGLVDEMGDEGTARRWLEREKSIPLTLPVHEVEPPDDTFSLRELVLGGVRKALSSERLTLDGLLALWQPGLR